MFVKGHISRYYQKLCNAFLNSNVYFNGIRVYFEGIGCKYMYVYIYNCMLLYKPYVTSVFSALEIRPKFVFIFL